MMRHASFVCAAALVAGLAQPVLAEEPVPGAGAPATVEALWVERDLSFTYTGFTSHYSCAGLRDKVALVLRQLGARPDFKLTTRNCVNMSGPEWTPGLRIVAAFPAEATPELLAELEASAPERELAARASGKPLTEATATFPARWKRVEFRSSRLDGIEDGDCELMEQLRRSVFDEIGVRVLEYDLKCVPRQVSLGSVRMTVEVLEPVPESPPAR